MDYRDFQNLNKKQDPGEHFWYKARRILINNLLRAALPVNNRQQKIMEIGCGTGIQLPLLQQFGQVEGLDISPESIAIIKANGFAGRVFDIEQESLDKNSTEIVACFDVLEHLQDDRSALKKITEALKDGGILFFSVPAITWLFSDHDRAVGHYRRYRRKEIIKKIEESGLKVKTINYWNTAMLPAIILMRLIKKVIKSKKPAVSEASPLPKFLNYWLYQILLAETRPISRGLKMPWGLSLYGYAIKNNR